jgi:thymidylate synthase (FAD)
MRIKANVLNWCRFLDKRLRNNAQYEIRVYAQAVAQIVQELFPWTWASFEEHAYNAVKFSASEMKLLKTLLNSVNEEKIAPAINHLNWPKSRVEEFLQKLALNSEDL